MSRQGGQHSKRTLRSRSGSLAEEAQRREGGLTTTTSWDVFGQPTSHSRKGELGLCSFLAASRCVQLETRRHPKRSHCI